MVKDNCQGTSYRIVATCPADRNIHLQERHDILQKLYRLMIDNGDDLGLIIVRTAQVQITFLSDLMLVDSRKWEDSCRGQGRECL
jgi:hypothetical protein